MPTWEIDLVGTKDAVVKDLNQEHTMPVHVKSACIQMIHIFNSEDELELNSIGTVDQGTGKGNLSISMGPPAVAPMKASTSHEKTQEISKPMSKPVESTGKSGKSV